MGATPNYSARLSLVCICVIHEITEVGPHVGYGGVGERSTSVRARRGAPPAEGVRRPSGAGCPVHLRGAGSVLSGYPQTTAIHGYPRRPAVIPCGPVRCDAVTNVLLAEHDDEFASALAELEGFGRLSGAAPG